MSKTQTIARDENIWNIPRQRGRTPTRTPDHLSAEIPDIFIPPTQSGNTSKKFAFTDRNVGECGHGTFFPQPPPPCFACR